MDERTKMVVKRAGRRKGDEDKEPQDTNMAAFEVEEEIKKGRRY